MAAAGIKAALEGLAAHLRANDVRADVDTANLSLPAVWVAVDTIRPELLDGNGTVLAALYLIVEDLAYLDALDALDELLAEVLDLVDTEGDVETQSVVLPDNSKKALPALRLRTIINYTRTE